MLTLWWAGAQLELLGERAVWWAATSTLVVADLHLGKPDAFTAAGIPVPGAVNGETLRRIGRLVDDVAPRRLLVLGDLLHARDGRSEELDARVRAWRAARKELRILLVRGNHDRSAGDPPAAWDVECVDEPFVEAGVAFCHHPGAAGGRPRLAGHVHPAVRVRAADGFGGRRPCFHLAGDCLVLPAFGAFTGAHAVRPGRGERVFAIDGGEVIEVTALLAGAAPPIAARHGEARAPRRRRGGPAGRG